MVLSTYRVRSDSEFQAAYEEGLESAESVLESMIEEINEYWEDEDQTPTSSEIRKNAQITTNKIFIVHGRDEGAKNMVARFLEKLNLEPVILAEIRQRVVRSSRNSSITPKSVTRLFC